MAHITAHDARSHGILASLKNFFSGWSEEIARQRVFNRTYDELASLSDRELSDIGLGRSEIIDVARDAASRV